MHASTFLVIATSVLGALAAPAGKAAPYACKNQKTVDYAGVKLRTCTASAFEGSTIKEYPGVKNIAECAKICATTAGCSRSLKSDLYQTAEVTDQVADGTSPIQCYGFNLYSNPPPKFPQTPNGAAYYPCLNSDYIGNSADIIGGVTSAADCAAVCSTRRGGFTCVWVADYNACHVKNEVPDQGLTFRRGFTTLNVQNSA